MVAAICSSSFCQLRKGITIQVLSDISLHNLCTSDSFETVVSLTPVSVFALEQMGAYKAA